MARLPTETPAHASGFNFRAALICGAAMVAPVLMAVIIHRFGVNVPYWDEWDQLAIVPHAYDHTLSVGLLLEQQNEHRPVVSKLISILMARITDLNLVAEMYVGFAFQVLSLILIWRMLAAGLKDRARVLIGPLTIAASCMLFWAVAHEDWIWGLASVQYLLSVLCAVLSVWALSRWPGHWLSTVILSAATTIAIFTTGCGFALIGVGILGILLYGVYGGLSGSQGNGSGKRKIPWLQLLAFALVSAGCIAVYLRGYSSPGYTATSLARLHPLRLATYFVTYLGSPFWMRSMAYRISLVFGVLGIMGFGGAAYYIIRLGRGWTLSALPWLLLAVYTLINGADTAFARIDFGVEQATASRYTPVVVLFWISLATLLTMIAYQLRTRFSREVIRMVSAAAIIVFMAGYWFLYYRGFGSLRRHSQYVAAGVPHILDYSHASDDELRWYHPNATTVRELSRKLDQYHLGPFAGARQGEGSVQ